MKLKVYELSQLSNQKLCMHLVPEEEFVYFLDTTNTSQTLLVKLPPMYIMNIVQGENSTTLASFIWKDECDLSILDENAYNYFKNVIPEEANLTWIPSILSYETSNIFVVPISQQCSCFDISDHLINTSECIQTGNLVETIIAVHGFKYMKQNNEVTCEIQYSIFQAKKCILYPPTLQKCEDSLFQR